MIQIVVFEFYISKPCVCPLSQCSKKSSQQNPLDNTSKYITKNGYDILINYLMESNRHLSAQIKDLIYTQKLKELEKLDPINRENHEPQSKPYKTMDEVEILIPLPLIEDGLHKGEFNWNPRKFSQYKMCHFLSSNHYENVNQHIDNENVEKINTFIRKHKKISSQIQTAQELIDIPSFTVSTYNTWNVNPFIYQRMQKIGKILSEFHVDIIALQEVRWTIDQNNGRNILQHQLILNELQSHQEWDYVMAQLILEKDDDDDEYLVIATRFEIKDSNIYNLTKSKGRIILYALIKIPIIGYIDVFAVHFDLEAQNQCWNIKQLIQIVNDYKLKHPDRLQIILGDFNTYLDFQYPMDLLTLNLQNKDNEILKQYLESKCLPFNVRSTKKIKRHKDLRQSITYSFENDIGPFNDSWKEIYGKDIDVMRTFTNFEDYRIEDYTITDRILFRNGNTNANTNENRKLWQVCDVWIVGDSTLNIKNSYIFPSDHRGVITKLYYN